MQFWYKRNLVSYCLMPLSFLYRLIIALRRLCYRFGLFKITQFKVPIIIVGNVTVGGTGKTPLVVWLANFLRLNGLKPGIVSRGYRSNADNYPFSVQANDDPIVVGDEPLLLARHTNCPIVIDPKRVRAVQYLLEHHDCNVVISDDGLQHYALDRDIEIVVLDSERRFGNGFCLPAGSLREPVGRLKQVDFVIAHGKPLAGEYAMELMPGHFYRVNDATIKQTADDFKGKTIHAVAGIGHPQRFFKRLRSLGLDVVEHSFPDHHVFKPSDLNYGDDAIVIMTEKDAVKCETFSGENLWCLSVKPQVDGEFGLRLLAKL